MNATQVREFKENQIRQAREKKVAAKAKEGKKLKFSIEDDRRDVARIRSMQPKITRQAQSSCQRSCSRRRHAQQPSP